MRQWRLVIVLLLTFLATRLAALEALPLHNDEGLHLTRAVEVWNLHPFWQINDGKIINHWLIAAFYPQNAPVFAGRVTTVLVAMIGLAAGCSVARQLAGTRGAALAIVLWIACPYLFFYERLALSDAEAGSLVLLTLWAALRLIQRERMRDAALAGLALAAAVLFKFTAVPFSALVVLVVIGLSREAWTRRLTYLFVIALVVATCFAVPLGYLALHKRDFFNIALGWIGGGSAAENGAAANLARLWTVLTGFGNLIWLVVMLIGLGALVVYGRRRGAILLATLLIPLASIVLLGSEVLPRHYIVALPLALVLGGAGVALAVERLMAPRWRWLAIAFAAAMLAVLFPTFALQAYHDPGNLPLPLPVRAQYITDHSSGYGLREAVLDFSNTLKAPDIPIIASMFPDSCHRANFYARDGRELICTQVPGRTEIEAALSDYGEVYVLTDNAPRIGIDVVVFGVQAEQIAAYPRPGETEASVVLWRLRRSED